MLINKIMEARCFKCKCSREIKNAKEVKIKGKGGTERKALTGVCSVCGTKMFKFIKQ